MTESDAQEKEDESALLRFQFRLKEFENNYCNVLEDDEFVLKFKDYLYRQFLSEDQERAKENLQRIFTQIYNGFIEKEGLAFLHSVWSKGVDGSNIILLQFLSEEYISLLQEQNWKRYVTEDLSHDLISSTALFLRCNKWYDFEKSIETLLKFKKYAKREEVGAGSLKSELFDPFRPLRTKEIFEKLLQLYLKGGVKQQKFIAQLYLFLGDDAFEYLLQRLFSSSEKELRFCLIELLKEFHSKIIPSLQHKVEDNLPWYVVRNIIVLITRTGDPENYSIIELFYKYEDERIQDEIVNAIFKLGGANVSARALHALTIVAGETSIKIIRKLANHAHEEEVGWALISCLQNKEQQFSDVDLLHEFVSCICTILKQCIHHSVYDKLFEVRESLKNQYGADDFRCLEITRVLHVVGPQLRHRAKQKGRKEITTENWQDFLDEYKCLLGNGEDNEITFSAVEDKELKGQKGRGEKKLSHFASLQDSLSDKEKSLFLKLLMKEHYAQGEVLLDEGNLDPCLYFIEKGMIKITYRAFGKEVFLKKLGEGDVIGAKHFFSAAYWTVCITSLQDTVVQVLDRNLFLQLYKNASLEAIALEEKIYNFVRSRENIASLLKMSGVERRHFSRFARSQIFLCQLLDQLGSRFPVKEFWAELIDISQGGLSFAVKFSKREIAEKLFGRRLLCFPRQDEDKGLPLAGGWHNGIKGTVVAVRKRQNMPDAFSVHIRFDEND